MDDLMNPTGVYGSVDSQPMQNPYSLYQAFSGARLAAGGPTTASDQSAYGNNEPRFYTTQAANLNNAGPPSVYQPVQPGYGAGVSSAPSQFAPGYYLRLMNRGNRSVRVARGVFLPTGYPAFQPPVTIDDSNTMFFDQAQPGMKFPLLCELPSRSLYFRVITIPTGQNQLGLYIPFETELKDRKVPVVTVAGIPVYAESPAELQVVVAYLSQFQQRLQNPEPPPAPPTPAPAPQQPTGGYGSFRQTGEAYQAYQAAQQQAAQQAAQPQASQASAPSSPLPEVTPVRVVPQAQAEPQQSQQPSLFSSALLLVCAAIATHYFQDFEP
jgi:hypothetical protein